VNLVLKAGIFEDQRFLNGTGLTPGYRAGCDRVELIKATAMLSTATPQVIRNSGVHRFTTANAYIDLRLGRSSKSPDLPERAQRQERRPQNRTRAGTLAGETTDGGVICCETNSAGDQGDTARNGVSRLRHHNRASEDRG
jgi:hypothetical protein